mmetsp:Transcript_21295/g.39176  ORF Transcript_21295/g.39176 Transcript_21295/m.39176 type:complete len:116 (+) Transcript_21295:104-451(+)
MKCTQIIRSLLPCIHSNEEPVRDLTSKRDSSRSRISISERIQLAPSFEEEKRRRNERRQLNIHEGPPLIVLHDVENNASVLYSSAPIKVSTKPKKKRVRRKKKQSRKNSKGPEMG